MKKARPEIVLEKFQAPRQLLNRIRKSERKTPVIRTFDVTAMPVEDMPLLPAGDQKSEIK